MAIVDLFHKRQKKLRGEYPDVYQYEELPNKLKVQIVHIWDETIGRDHSIYNTYPNPIEKVSRSILEQAHKILIKELGVFDLPANDENDSNFFTKIASYFLNESDVEISLSVVEIMMWAIILFHRTYRKKFKLEDIVDELNQRFRENGIGYQYENGQILRMDSEFIHAEAVKPALQLLSNPMYKGAQEEFLKAHEHYRHGRYDAALTDCLKAFESTMKIILDKRDWEYGKKDSSKRLVDCCLANGLIPTFWTDHFNSLSNMLTSSIGTPRNKLSGHGKGNDEIVVPEHLIQYVLHMTASTIVFLIKAEASLD
tara:strand:+ start:519 stop:1454 length:936 start_codon:yes stop_codon:yes gene_type:complete